MPLPEKEFHIIEKKLTVKIMTMINLKNRVQSRTRTLSSIVYVLYILLYIYDI